MRELGEVRDKYGCDLVWTAEKIVHENVDLRTDEDFKTLYMPFDPLMSFGDTGDGSRFAYVRTPERDDVFVWEHESDGRWFAADNMADFLQRYFTSEIPDWYQQLISRAPAPAGGWRRRSG